MKVLLFVQTGDARPKVAGVAHESAENVRGHIFFEVRLDGLWDPRMFVGESAGRAKNAADRWWLVECENAADGRWIITFDGKVFDEQGNPIGRILASGGKP